MLALTLVGLLWLVAQRHAEAADARAIWSAGMELRQNLSRELGHDARMAIQASEAEAKQGSESSTPAMVERRAARLRAAGLVIDLMRSGAFGQVLHGDVLPGTAPPGVTLAVHAGRLDRLLAGADGHYYLVLSKGERRQLARLLGAHPEAVVAAVRLDQAAVERAAQRALTPLHEVTFYSGSRSFASVRLKVDREGVAHVERLEAPYLQAAMISPTREVVSLRTWSDWPRFLLLGGSEIPGFVTLEDQHGQQDALQVTYLSDLDQPARERGMSLVIDPQFHAPVPVLSPWVVGAAVVMLAALWCAVLAVALRRAAPTTQETVE